MSEDAIMDDLIKICVEIAGHGPVKPPQEPVLIPLRTLAGALGLPGDAPEDAIFENLRLVMDALRCAGRSHAKFLAGMACAEALVAVSTMLKCRPSPTAVELAVSNLISDLNTLKFMYEQPKKEETPHV